MISRVLEHIKNKAPRGLVTGGRHSHWPHPSRRGVPSIRSIVLLVCSDQRLRGAALDAVQIAEHLF
jgi:hypothetical protein